MILSVFSYVYHLLIYFLWWNFYLNNLPIFNWVPCLFFFFNFACTTWHAWFSVPPPGIEPMPPAWETWSFNHWTDKEVPGCLSSYWVVRTLCIFWSKSFIRYLIFENQIFSPNLWYVNKSVKQYSFKVILFSISCNSKRH